MERNYDNTFMNKFLLINLKQLYELKVCMTEFITSDNIS